MKLKSPGYIRKGSPIYRESLSYSGTPGDTFWAATIVGLSTTVPVGIAARDIKAGEWIEYDAKANTADIIAIDHEAKEATTAPPGDQVWFDAKTGAFLMRRPDGGVETLWDGDDFRHTFMMPWSLASLGQSILPIIRKALATAKGAETKATPATVHVSDDPAERLEASIHFGMRDLARKLYDQAKSEGLIGNFKIHYQQGCSGGDATYTLSALLDRTPFSPRGEKRKV